MSNKILDDMRDVMRRRHYSIRTERSYCGVTVHTPWQPTGFCRVSIADKVAPKGVFSMDCALKPEKGCWLS
ncbi:MAG: hypothetical protein U9N19_08265, partial [Thermodesulfobacteriota bacterium]|nr:hypothetical protein [Thermodesulfobacteriota bacterium]